MCPVTTVRKEKSIEMRFEHLNQAQQKAVFTQHQNIITIAPAGTGKTSVLAHRIAQLLLEQKVIPERILALTFGKKASLEVREKLLSVLDDRQSLAERVQVFTFHGFAFRVLKSSGLKFKLLTEDSQKEKLLLPILRKHSVEADLAGEILAQLGLIINMGIPLHQLEVRKNEEERERLKVFEAYQAAKQKEKLLDFDDLLQQCLQTIATRSQMAKLLANQFDHVIIDETQDLNHLEISLLRLLTGENTQVFAVGDPKQSIFSFRGSTSRVLLHLQKQMKDAATHQLTQNYRSTEAIITLANQIIGDDSLQAVKKGGAAPILISPSDEKEEARQVIQMIRDEKLPLKEQCILYRTSESAHTLVEQLVKAKIPLNISGSLNLVYHHPKVAPIISHFNLMNDTATLQDLRQILITLYISPKLIEIDNKKEDEISLAAALTSPKLDHHQQGRILDLLELYDEIRELPPNQICQRIRQHGYEAYALKGYPLLSDHRQRVIDRLDAFQDSLAGYKTLTGFLTFLSRLEQAVNSPKEEGLKLSTIHGAKGLEYEKVYLISAIEGILPHQRALEAQKGFFPGLYPDEGEALEEESRLAYVAVTRAKDKLVTSAPKQVKDKTVDVSRFFSVSGLF